MNEPFKYENETTAPDAIKTFAARLMATLGTRVNLSVLLHRDGADYIDRNQHGKDKHREDQLVWKSSGAARPFAVRPLGKVKQGSRR